MTPKERPFIGITVSLAEIFSYSPLSFSLFIKEHMKVTKNYRIGKIQGESFQIVLNFHTLFKQKYTYNYTHIKKI